MIRCNKCRKLWPKGTVFCGSCGGSLGCRICDHGHENPLTTKFCLVCGSKKMSYGVAATNLRPRLVAILSIPLVGFVVIMGTSAVFALESAKPLTVSVDGWCQIIFLISLAVFVLGGAKGRKAVVRFYFGLIRLLFGALAGVLRSALPGKSHNKN